MKVFYSDEYVAMAHSVDATKKPQWVAESLGETPIPGVQLASPEPVTADQLHRIHSPEYITAVKTGRPRRLAQSSTFPWDTGLWTAELASCGGMVSAAQCALDEGVAGSLSVGFHHARQDQGSGHCIFNGLALAICALHDQGLSRILCIDLDAHCGGGTYSIAGSLPGYRQLDVSLFPTDRYQPVAPSTLDMVDSKAAYLKTIERRLAEAEPEAAGIQWAVYYAGMDPHEGSAFGGMPGFDARLLEARDRLVFEWLAEWKIQCAWAIGGGYLGPGLERPGLVALHRTTIELAAS